MHNKLNVFVEVPQKAGSTVRVATDDEKRIGSILQGEIAAKRARLASAQAELERAFASCDHKLIYDAPGYDFDIRVCWVCGRQLGLI